VYALRIIGSIHDYNAHIPVVIGDWRRFSADTGNSTAFILALQVLPSLPLSKLRARLALVDVHSINMFVLRRRKTTSSIAADAVGSLRRTWTGSTISLRRRRLNQVDATLIHALETEGEVVLSTISTALGVLRDIACAFQAAPYAGAIAVVAVKVLEIREVR
jgi:hypothetical protein